MAKKKKKTKRKAVRKAAPKKNRGDTGVKNLRKVTGSTGWMKANAVRFVKKRGGTEVYIRRNKPRKKAKGKK